MPKTIGYLRVSTVEQDLDKNKTDILRLAHAQELGQVEFVEEKASGRIHWRKRKIADVLGSLAQDDHLIVSAHQRSASGQESTG